ncbi:hypothetical protein N7449_009527 [Penicillium cf. viridicatum]|uniref:beta-glucosidase n=1 Tax=Penicillium cf. viridicatum TaxID=2972119 RepID=A0A9W9JAJ6_9EURO|nr:hypothetical protein N7449_009527 [Penicillium cf. viridicatum]
MAWIWHPEWTEYPTDSAGAFVHFRKTITLTESISKLVHIQITADTKYKLYINSEFVSVGPVKGDRHLWFYDELDIQPYLRLGANTISVRVLRLYHATTHATRFPRLHVPGLLIRNGGLDPSLAIDVQTNDSWETAVDESTTLPTDISEDGFLHVYEKAGQYTTRPNWPRANWEEALLGPHDTNSEGIRLPAGSRHHLELEVKNHTTALLYFRFKCPEHAGSTMQVTYSECYEDVPDTVPWIRRKGDRRDTRKKLIGPKDEYRIPSLADQNLRGTLNYKPNYSDEDVFAPSLQILRLVHDLYGGDETGNAIADVVFGAVNPSGKMPLSFPRRNEDNPAFLNFRSERGSTKYGEGVYIGYRFYEKCKKDVAFPFGHRLSYTTFKLSSISLQKTDEEISITVNVQNTGNVDGAEVVQVYVSQQSPSINRPPKELKGFEKVFLRPQQTETVTVKILTKYATSFWDEYRNAWVQEAGRYIVQVGTSNVENPLSADFEIGQTTWWNGL